MLEKHIKKFLYKLWYIISLISISFIAIIGQGKVYWKIFIFSFGISILITIIEGLCSKYLPENKL
ncbi:hypothetical protein AALM99_06925 [Lactococcus muris]|uniref:Uncharacterized protein n=1 Tax=Lactococcus muris TaxID=2941330 RepID=A0ABV4D8U4_9LACT|nr:hypothetical protein [Lactococcus ileimucosae]